ncbi:MAG: carboxypeptidase-like regulatory domain-containing protein, partial [Thermogemmata sp.]
MWGRGAVNVLLLLLLAVSGCKTSERSREGREPAAMPAARGKQPAWLDPSAQLPGAKTGVPKGGPWSRTTAAASDALGGRVVDALGRPAKNVFIRIEPLPSSPGGAMGIYSDDQGYFLTRGLKPGQSYQLTAEAQQQGRRWRGTVQTKVPNTTLTLVLREDPASGADAGSVGTGDPLLPPPEGVPRSRTPRASSDGAFQPDGGSGQPVPPSLPPSGRLPSGGAGGTGGGTPAAPAIPPPQNLAPPLRPENTADGPRPPYTPPPVSIPGPPSLPPPPPPPPVPKLPVPPSGSPTPPQNSSQSQVGKPFTVVLVDPLQRPWSFPGDSSARVVVLEFVTSDCPH